ncbi:hypothetical protein FACS1894127_5420 [Clostridia bacterium]|nr:hypothetical protein FACS1894127_5420 [Clostridia bacterium]
MDILIIPIPLFDENVAVKAYLLKNRRGNEFLDGTGNASLDKAMVSPPLEMLNIVGLEALTMGKSIFVPVTRFMLLSRLEIQSNQPAEKLVFLIDGSEIENAGNYADNMARLKNLGYSFAIQNIKNLKSVEPLLAHCSFVFWDARVFGERERELQTYFSNTYNRLANVYANIESLEQFEEISATRRGLFEGDFYRLPVSKGMKEEVEPLHVNLINLLNTVQEENFDFDEISGIIEHDPALAVSLLRVVNSVHFSFKEKVKSINQAVVLLGQKEVTKWITTAVTRQLGANKPGELTRLALVRARFAEEVAVLFGLEDFSQSIFLMGLFSALDAMLDLPMEDALKQVRVSDDIYNTLVNRNGPYNPVYQFILDYESANWTNVSRMMIVRDVHTAEVYKAYLGAMLWYNKLLREE